MRNISNKSRENQNTHLVFSNFFSRKSCRLWDNMEKYCKTGQATDDNMVHAHCMLYTYVYKYTLRICNTYCFFFVFQQWLDECASILRCAYVHCLSCFHLMKRILPFHCPHSLYGLDCMEMCIYCFVSGFCLFCCVHTINEINHFLLILIKNTYKIVVAENWSEQNIEET